MKRDGFPPLFILSMKDKMKRDNPALSISSMKDKMERARSALPILSMKDKMERESHPPFHILI